MLAIARALMSEPRLLMLDEPSLGLSPKMADEVFDVVREINRHGVTVLLVEQNVHNALSVAYARLRGGNRAHRRQPGRGQPAGRSGAACGLLRRLMRF